MDINTVIGLTGIAGMLCLILFCGMSPGVAMLLAGTCGSLALVPPDSFSQLFTGVIGAEIWSTFSSYGLTVIPLFVLLGEIIYHAGYSNRLFQASEAWLGGCRGGLAMTTLLASAGFSAICGSNTATAATMCSVALEPMTKAKYHPQLKCGSIAVGSTLGAMIPPSIVLVVYGLYTGSSIGKLFAGSVVPSAILVGSFLLTVAVLCRLRPDFAQPGPKASWRKRFAVLPSVLEILVLFAVIMGAMFSGIVTPTEAAGFGTFIGILGCLLRRRLSYADLRAAMIATLHITGMVFMILAGATVFGKFLSLARLPQLLASSVAGSTLSPTMIILLMAGCYVLGGCLMDALAFLLITLPLFIPLIERMGLDLVWFGQVVCLLTTLGAITPPVGVSSFVVASRSKDSTIGQVFQGTLYFMPAYLLVFLMLLWFPQPMVNWLAGMAK